MKKFFISIISAGVMSSIFESIVFYGDHISVNAVFSQSCQIYPHDIQKVIFSRFFGYFKVMLGSKSLTFSAWKSKEILKNFQVLGIICEPYNKKVHNPFKSTHHFWFYQ